MVCRQPVAAACRSGVVLLVATLAGPARAEEPLAPRLLGADNAPNPASLARPLDPPPPTDLGAEPPVRGPILLPPGFVIGPWRSEVVVSLEPPVDLVAPLAAPGPTARRGWQAAGDSAATRVDAGWLPATCCEPAGLASARGVELAGAVAGGVAETLGGGIHVPVEQSGDTTSAAAARMGRAALGGRFAAEPVVPEPTGAIARTILDLMHKTGPSVIDGSAFDVPEPGCAADASTAAGDRRLAILEELLRLERAAAPAAPRPLQVVRAERPEPRSSSRTASSGELDLQTRLNWFELAVRLETLAETLERGGDAQGAAELRSAAARARHAMHAGPAIPSAAGINSAPLGTPAAIDLARQVADLRAELGRIRATLGLRDQDPQPAAEPRAQPAAPFDAPTPPVGSGRGLPGGDNP